MEKFLMIKKLVKDIKSITNNPNISFETKKAIEQKLDEILDIAKKGN